jgi:hypothetical protein
MIKHFSEDWIREWCYENGWTDLFLNRRDYWAFPPNGVMPLPIPKETLLEIKADKGFSEEEKVWLSVTVVVSFLATILSYFLRCPMPLVFAFAFSAIVVANFDVD